MTNGRYDEFPEHQHLVRIGMAVVDSRSGEVKYIEETDTMYSENGLQPEIISRWLSIDPLAAKYPYLSPYVGMADNPILFSDGDGRDIIITNVTAEQARSFAARITASTGLNITVESNTDGAIVLRLTNNTQTTSGIYANHMRGYLSSGTIVKWANNNQSGGYDDFNNGEPQGINLQLLNSSPEALFRYASRHAAAEYISGTRGANVPEEEQYNTAHNQLIPDDMLVIAEATGNAEALQATSNFVSRWKRYDNGIPAGIIENFEGSETLSTTTNQDGSITTLERHRISYRGDRMDDQSRPLELTYTVRNTVSTNAETGQESRSTEIQSYDSFRVGSNTYDFKDQ
jgi:hypothetical protein